MSKIAGNDHIGHTYGNFHNYYSFHPSKSRTELIPKGSFLQIWNSIPIKPSKFYYLDVGCNEGDLSYEIYSIMSSELREIDVECYLLGLDIDEELIVKANEKYSDNKYISFLKCNIMTESEVIDEYLFQNQISQFSIVSAFSITMWIHINHGDDGLKLFLDKITTYTLSSLFIEPQQWKSYKNAMKRMRKLEIIKPLAYDSLIQKNEVEVFIYDYLIVQFVGNWKLGKDSWNRTFLIFHKFSCELLFENIKSDISRKREFDSIA